MLFTSGRRLVFIFLRIRIVVSVVLALFLCNANFCYEIVWRFDLYFEFHKKKLVEHFNNTIILEHKMQARSLRTLKTVAYASVSMLTLLFFQLYWFVYSTQ